MNVVLNEKNVSLKSKDANKKKRSAAMEKCVEGIIDSDNLFEVDRLSEEKVAEVDRDDDADVNERIETEGGEESEEEKGSLDQKKRTLKHNPNEAEGINQDTNRMQRVRRCRALS
jgi:hypothetical protein